MCLRALTSASYLQAPLVYIGTLAFQEDMHQRCLAKRLATHIGVSRHRQVKKGQQPIEKGPDREANCPQLKAVAKDLAGTRPNYIHGFTVAVIIRPRKAEDQGSLMKTQRVPQSDTRASGSPESERR